MPGRTSRGSSWRFPDNGCRRRARQRSARRSSWGRRKPDGTPASSSSDVTAPHTRTGTSSAPSLPRELAPAYRRADAQGRRRQPVTEVEVAGGTRPLAVHCLVSTLRLLIFDCLPRFSAAATAVRVSRSGTGESAAERHGLLLRLKSQSDLPSRHVAAAKPASRHINVHSAPTPAAERNVWLRLRRSLANHRWSLLAVMSRKPESHEQPEYDAHSVSPSGFRVRYRRSHRAFAASA